MLSILDLHSSNNSCRWQINMHNITFRTQLEGYFGIFHPLPSITVSIILMLVALPLHPTFGIGNLLFTGFTMLWVQFFIGLTNDILDQPFDSIAKPTKPLISGVVKPWTAYILAVILSLLIVVFGLQINNLAFTSLLFVVFLGLSYNLGIKRTVWSWVPFALFIPTILICARLANGNGVISNNLIFWVYPLGLLLGPALNMANQMNMVEESAASGEKSLLHVLGIKKGKYFSVILLAGASIITFIASLLVSTSVVLIILFCSGALLSTLFFAIFAIRDSRKLLFPAGIATGTFLGLTLLII